MKQKVYFTTSPNDIFNDSARSYMSTNGRIDIKGGNEGRKKLLKLYLPGSTWTIASDL